MPVAFVVHSVQSGRDNDIGLRGVILKRAKSPPRITARRGGGVTKKMRRRLLIDAAGVVFLVPSIGTPPRPRESGCCAIFLDCSATPPRGDARRGIRLVEKGVNLDSCGLERLSTYPLLPGRRVLC